MVSPTFPGVLLLGFFHSHFLLGSVRKYEEEMRMKETQKKDIRTSWDDEMVSPTFRDDDTPPSKAEEEPIDYSKMTVAQLKDLLRSKGMKLSGKKAELIERLESS